MAAFNQHANAPLRPHFAQARADGRYFVLVEFLGATFHHAMSAIEKPLPDVRVGALLSGRSSLPRYASGSPVLKGFRDPYMPGASPRRCRDWYIRTQYEWDEEKNGVNELPARSSSGKAQRGREN